MFSKPNRKWTVVVARRSLVAGVLRRPLLEARRNALPKGIASGNGRIESKEVDVAAKLPLRVKEVLVAEGDLVKPGQVVVRMDTVTLDAELAEAKASVAAAQEQLAVASAAIVKKKSEIELAKIEKERSRKLVAERAGSQRELDVRTMTLEDDAAPGWPRSRRSCRSRSSRSRSPRPTSRRSRAASTTRR